MNLLDHGSVELIETWGSDERIIEAARMSTAKGFQGWGPVHAEGCDVHKVAPVGADEAYACTCSPKPGDEKLLRYLWEHGHHTPFEMAGAIFEIQAPIFVFREWHRHRTQSYNELSARYTPMPNVNYVPTMARLLSGYANSNSANKQAQRRMAPGEVIASEDETRQKFGDWLDRLQNVYAVAQDVYEDGLALGVPKELARLPVPVARYSRMRASANLRNWLHFLELRQHASAQWEIRQYANAVHDFLAERFPRTLALFDEGR